MPYSIECLTRHSALECSIDLCHWSTVPPIMDSHSEGRNDDDGVLVNPHIKLLLFFHWECTPKHIFISSVWFMTIVQ
jgi:hypothetical protein